jgi:molybdenum cofactor cytidylyltransferase
VGIQFPLHADENRLSTELALGNRPLISGIILASGFSKRMGTDKLMLCVKGVPLVERAIRAATSSRLSEVILVYRREEVAEIARRYNVKALYNGQATEGQSAAVKVGIASAHPETHGFMFFVGDQPYLNSSTVDTLIGTFEREKHPIVVPIYEGKRGNPVLFSSELKEDLLAIEGDTGGRAVIERMASRVKQVPIEEGLVGLTIDSRQAYELLKESAEPCAD